MACSRPPSQCDPTTLPPGPPAGRWPLPFSRRRREMSSNKEQRSAVFVVLFALITILILYSSNSANEVFHYGSLRGRSRRPVNLKKWSFSNAYFPILGNKTLPSRCNQCVIVTSSSHLLGTKLGPEIERAECTIRMNDAPTTGYSADVGNKTTFRVVAHSSVFRVLRKPQEFVNRTPETVFIFWGPPNKMQKPQGSLLRVIQRAGLAFPNMEAYAVSQARMQQFDDLFRDLSEVQFPFRCFKEPLSIKHTQTNFSLRCKMERWFSGQGRLHSSRGPELGFQHPHQDRQLTATCDSSSR
ncbi:alpha-N-acetylgalactosaminide alpha-2,6-sialyltransferase 6 isoform X4 [Rattus rattus]|uniref:alpha-N-acetylgalactosaminide alpha-2,6-sialyltransferase 6 isoform X4 n=1 Tax=Rattus rattus TaxID=10117 RepID=UPI0013F2FAC8|nr:alpha-N-acetylgalactosaminide alpha-2,6-sialyltransferase 6 isoform X4 [Rattus rattus]